MNEFIFLGLVNGEEMNRVCCNRKVRKMKGRRHQEVGGKIFATLAKMVPSTCKTLLHEDEQFLQRKHNSNE